MVMGTILWLYFSGEKIHWTIQESVYVCGIGDEAKNGNKTGDQSDLNSCSGLM